MLNPAAPPADRWLEAEALTATAFAPFGDVIDLDGAPPGRAGQDINQGHARRYDDLAALDLAGASGQARLSLFHARPRELPLRLRLLERHPLGSQAFLPLSGRPWLVVVAPADARPDLARLRCFRVAPGQGVNYRAGVWHHPLIALQAPSDFLVIDRAGPGDNCDEFELAAPILWTRG